MGLPKVATETQTFCTVPSREGYLVLDEKGNLSDVPQPLILSVRGLQKKTPGLAAFGAEVQNGLPQLQKHHSG